MINRILFLLAAFCFSALILHADSTPGKTQTDAQFADWSQSVKGLRACLFTEPSHDPTLDRTFEVGVAFQEVGLDTSLGMQHLPVVIRFTPAELRTQITNAKGQPMAMDNAKLPETTAIAYDLILPPSGRIRFPVGHGGSRPHSLPGLTPPPGKLLQLDTLGEWLLLLAETPCHLSAILEIDPLPSSDKRVFPYRVWEGTLTLPEITLPAQ